MKTNLVILLFCIFFSKIGNSQSLPDDKSIIVEMFASNIFNVDEDLNGVYERENDLINYCANRNYKIAILNRLQMDLPNIFSDDITCSAESLASIFPLVGIFAHRLCAAGDSDAHSTSVFIEYKFILGFFFH